MQTVDALRLWEQPCEGVVFRLSATIEDGSAHSFAGIFESLRASTPEEFEPTVLAIWASVSHRAPCRTSGRLGVRQLPAMAVIAQRFLRASAGDTIKPRPPSVQH